LVRKGHDVTVYTTDAAHIGTPARIKERFQLIDGAKVFYFPNAIRRYGMFISPGIIQALRENLRSFDVVHLHEFRTFQNLAFYYSERKRAPRNVPYVLTLHGQLEIKQEHSDVRILRRLFNYTFGSSLLKNANKILALSELESSQLIQRGVDRDKIVIIPNAIALEDFSNPPPKGYFKRLLGLDSEEIILYIGRISSLKGPDILVKAFSLLRKPNNLRLVLAGPDDGFSNSLRQIIESLGLKGEVLFTGTLDRSQVLGALNDASVVVYATSQEGFPMVPLEAGIMGTPIIVSNHPSMDFVREGHFGLGVDYGNATQLKDALERVLEDRALARELGKNGKRYVTENFEWGTMVKRFEDEYLQLA
jgi:glycosyltransferase involved in cell wall biosynthesis